MDPGWIVVMSDSASSADSGSTGTVGVRGLADCGRVARTTLVLGHRVLASATRWTTSSMVSPASSSASIDR